MAGDWIKMRTDLDRDPAVILLAEHYGWPEYCIVGLLYRLWSWADGQLSDGTAPVGPEFINRFLSVDGFAEQLAKVGWLEITEDGIAFPNWDYHLSKSAKTRANKTKTKQAERCRHSVAKMSPCDGDKQATREEKSREDKVVSKDTTSAPADAGDTPNGSEYGFPLQGGSTYYVTDRKLAEYQDTYADLDLDQQFRTARQWLRDNKPRRPRSGTGVLQFLTRWLNRQLDQHGGTKRQNGSRSPVRADCRLDGWEDWRQQVLQQAKPEPGKYQRLVAIPDAKWQEQYAALKRN